MICRVVALSLVAAAMIVDAGDATAVEPVDAADERSAEQLVDAAVTAHDELRFDDARVLLEQAWHRGGSDAAQLRTIFSLSGLAAGAMGDADAARLWFSRWLSVEPDATLPAGSSPKLAALFAEARRGLGGASVAAVVRRVGDDVEVVLATDPLSLVTRVRVGDRVVEIAQGKTITLPAADEAELLDRDGNVVAVVPARLIEPPLQDAPSWYARWSVWASATVGLAVISGASFGLAAATRSDWRELNAMSAAHEASDAIALERRFERTLWVSRIALGGALVTGVVSGVLFSRRSEQQVAVMPTSGGATVAWTLGF